MFAESLVSSLKARLGGDPALAAEDFCRFWTRPDGIVCAQHVQTPHSAIYRPHSHPEYGIVICLQGEVSKVQFGTHTIIGPGEVVISNSGIEHASGYLAGSAGSEAVCLTVEPRGLLGLLERFHLAAMGDESGPVFTGKFHSSILHDCARDLARELRTRDIGHEIVVEGLATRILVEAMRAWPRRQVGSCALDRTPRLSRRDFVRAYEFMRWCRKDAFRVGHLCEFLGTSEERFARLFLAATHSTPASFYNELLIERGCALLQEASLPVKTIGYDLGFRTCSHFIASFKRRMGMTPQDYRRQWFNGLAVADPASDALRSLPAG
jgi:AraC-like DNA-binding protein